MIAELAALVAAELPTAVALRHRLHADPRVSGQEDDTAEAVSAAIGLPRPAERVAGTGRLLRVGPATGPSVALRAELDGLPVLEQTGLPFAATSGVMHACGHDLHCAALVAVARAARLLESELPCGLLLVLQPREEASPTGAGDVLASPAFVAHDVRAVIGAHVQPVLPRGVVSARRGAVNASCDELTITVAGRGGHAAYPHRADDPVLALSQTVVALHHLVSRRVDPLDAAVLTIGRLDAGTASNVIPPVARAYGTIRALDPDDRKRLREAAHEVVTHTAAAYGCTGALELVENEPVLHNDPRLASAILPALVELGLRPDEEFRSCGSDDFAHYSEALPSAMLFVGVDEGVPGSPGLHNARFAPPDDVLGELAGAYLAGLAGALTLLG
ncbi:MAG TPA: M20 family metallopeptidase [Pseudonocardia sp.]|nr:M20 family metallopeptidase [Pseudonocardia sp.]